VRYDDPSNADADWNYRLGLVWRPRKETALKLLYGTAARAPNVYELFYTVPGATPFEPNPLLSLEHIQTAEIVWEQVVADHLKFTASAYRYEMKGLINQEIVDGALMFINIPPVKAHGLELEAEARFRDGVTMRGSLAMQATHSSGTGQDLTNSPRGLATVNLTVPLLRDRINAALEAQYVGSRRADLATVSGYTVANFTLRAFDAKKGYDASLSIYNLFGKRLFDPAGFDPSVPTRFEIEQDGTTVRAKLAYRF
jgi:iron complex outermembrane receptor protein